MVAYCNRKYGTQTFSLRRPALALCRSENVTDFLDFKDTPGTWGIVLLQKLIVFS
jgi:hypothetical protein